jgi:hypothetical protein
MALGTVWLACLALHVILCITKFDGDLLILPLLSLLLLIGAAYHLDLPGPATPGMSPGPYTSATPAGDRGAGGSHGGRTLVQAA